MTWWQAVILGLVEGITEYLPVSSTGHLILASWLLGLPDNESLHAFEVVIQGGAILAVLGLYAHRVRQMLEGIVLNNKSGRRLLINVVVAFLPAAVLGPVLDHPIDAVLFGPIPVLFAMFVVGVWMVWLGWRRAGDPPVPLDDLTPINALKIGFLQCFAMWPGTSRSMMTIAGGTLVGLNPVQAAEFSFLVGLPTLGAATVFKLFKNLWHAHKEHTPNLFEALGYLPVFIGIVVAAISAALAVRWLVSFLGARGLAPFGYYRIVLSIVLGALVIFAGLSFG